MTAKQFPVVLRFEGMDPSDIGGYEAHRYRKNGDLGHIDRDKPKPRLLIGTATWAEEALAEIKLIRMETFAAELTDLDRRNRRKDLKKRRIEGPRDPWRASRHGPMREILLTANKEWFDETASGDELFNTAREEQFEERAVAWLKESFGDDVIHARADTDEQAYHIHAVIMPRATVHNNTDKDARKDEKVQREACQAVGGTFDEWAVRMKDVNPDLVGEIFFQFGCFATAADRRKILKHALLPEGVAERIEAQLDAWKAEAEAERVAAEAAKETSGKDRTGE